MSISNDALIALRARRCDLYEELTLIDRHVAAVQNSPFFSTRAGNAVTMQDSIEGVEGQIAHIDRQMSVPIEPARREPRLKAEGASPRS